MKVLKTSDIEAKERGGGLFKGRVTVQSVLDSDDSALRTNLINFDEGAVNVFHTHDFDQVLYVTAGEGIIATEKEEIRITPGTFVVIPAGEKHWHGATPGSSFSHIAISIRGKTTF
ncbi:MAG: cupin domain-containing protein [Alphaproteobacteria bacterium]|nr:cupin domain-containing protein [Alphaproteobacteria bacterium]